MANNWVKAVLTLSAAHRDIMRGLAERGAGVEGNLTGPQLLLILGLNDREMPINQLTAVYFGENVSYNVDKLGKLGYLNTRSNPNDLRVKNVSLSPRGRALRNKIMAAAAKDWWLVAGRPLIDGVLAVILANPGVVTRGRYLIWSEEHSGWWAPGSAGYASRMDRAGRYAAQEAAAIVADANRYSEPDRWNEIAVIDPTWQPE